MSVNRLYTPTTDELNEAINEFLYKNETANSKEVRAALMTSHSNWKVPERRVLKYVKRQKKEKSAADTATSGDSYDDDKSISVRVSRRVKGVKKALISSVKRRGANKATPSTPTSVISTATTQESAPTPKEEPSSSSPPLPSVAKVESAENKEEKTAEPGADGESVKADKSLDASKIYQDEDAQESSAGPCHACEGCNIL